MELVPEQLATISAAMNAMTLRSNAVISYDLLADALYWTDEIPPLGNHRSRDFWCLRFVLRYRTSIILNNIENDYEEYWKSAIAHFPNWAGFHESRRTPSEEYAKIYYEMKSKGMQTLIKMHSRDKESTHPD